MLRGYRYQIRNLNQSNKIKIHNYVGCYRHVYNSCLWLFKYRLSEGKWLSQFDMIKLLPELKEIYPFYKNVNAATLQQAVIDLYKGISNWKNPKLKAKFPKFKKYSNKQSTRFINSGIKNKIPTLITIDFTKNTIKLPSIGKLNFYSNEIFTGLIKNVTITKDTIGKYWLSVLVDNHLNLPELKEFKEETTVGLDVGIKTLVHSSDNEIYENPKYFNKEQRRLKYLQRCQSRKVKGSNRNKKAKLKVAKQHNRIKNLRENNQHKITSEIVKKYDTIIVEDLNVSGMIKNRKLSKTIQDASWGNLSIKFEYKCKFNGKNYIEIDRFAPSSKKCSNCGYINKDLTLKIREWICKKCHVQHDRDLNAAINIKNYGIQIILKNLNENLNENNGRVVFTSPENGRVKSITNMEVSSRMILVQANHPKGVEISGTDNINLLSKEEPVKCLLENCNNLNGINV